MERRSVSIAVPDVGTVSSRLDRPENAWGVYVLAHGAGAGMEHAFLARVAAELGARGMATLRYQFPYMERGGRRPDPPARAVATVRAAVAAARDQASDLPIVAGGKSFGGRMTSTAQADDAMEGVRGLAFLGFPLHAPGRPGDARGAHLSRVEVPMLFCQGTRDPLAGLDLMRPLCDRLGSGSTLHVVDGGDHSFKVLKKSGRTHDEVMAELADTIVDWARPLATE
jgi:predicted alpha/beta-hydrolase family hydrolase